MNNIQKLQVKVAGVEAQAQYLMEQLHTFRAFLHGPKFQGEGNDYIQTADVLNWIRETETSAHAVRETAIDDATTLTLRRFPAIANKGWIFKDGKFVTSEQNTWTFDPWGREITKDFTYAEVDGKETYSGTVTINGQVADLLVVIPS